MAPILYMHPASPPVRAVLLCAKSLDLELQLKELNLLEKEHLQPEFLKLNPTHTVPTLDDNGFVIWDSHVIMPYLVKKYGKSHDLYPIDIKKRAIVDLRLHFDSSTVFPRAAAIIRPTIFQGKKDIDPPQMDNILEAYGVLETFLHNSKYIAGDNLTIADFSILTTITSVAVLVPIDAEKYPKLTNWIKHLQELPVYEQEKKRLAIFANVVKPKTTE